VILSLEGRAVADPDELRAALEEHAVGQTVQASVWRGGTAVKLAIVVGERPRRG
jgi:S1-C subfamily serine protease